MTEQPSYNVAKLLSIGLVFHLIFIASVFDCYFTSPVVHGMQRYRVPQAEAKRLVLIIGDGLRTDTLFQPNAFLPLGYAFEDNEFVAPFIRYIASFRGAFGISHTHVPTESRPGHVAIIGGMYEDVSAVTKGWKTNPVDFDSVFNQSRVTYGFGSPDIIPMFAHGATPGKVKMWCYNEADEDFTKDATVLDTWAFEQLQTLLHNATTDPELNAELHSDQVIIFLHLLGLDTTGHTYRPFSPEYMRNIRIVDNIVQQTEALVNDFFNDNETSFIFTADHGMSNIGNHGDGSLENTMTPLVAWGKGIRGPLDDSYPMSSHNVMSYAWKLYHLLRQDVEQADLAPMMATLLGIDWPVNSVGVLPGIRPSQQTGYLAFKEGEKGIAEAALVNAKVLLEHYRVKHELMYNRSLIYSPYKPLESTSDGPPAKVSRVSEIDRLISEGRYNEAREKSWELCNEALSGLRYLETYQRTMIRWIVSAAYLGWIVFSSMYVFRPPAPASSSWTLNAIAAGVTLVFWVKFAIEKAPWTYYVYIAFPCYFWHQFSRRASPLLSQVRKLANKKTVIKRVFLTILSLLAMVTGYTHRSIWSLSLLIMGVYWPRNYWDEGSRQRVGKTRWSWTIMCLVTAVFPFLDVDKTESIPTIVAGAAAILVTGYVAMTQMRGQNRGLQNTYVFYAQAFLIVLTSAVTVLSALSLQAKQGLPRLYQVLGWISLVAATLVPLLSPIKHTSPLSKMTMIFLAFSPCFVILSISVEGLFYVAYSITLYFWVQLEAAYRDPHLRQRNQEHYTFSLDDLRIVLFFLLFVQVGFFGTGNVASISSFYLSPVYRLIPIFNPFFMATLLIFKIIVPYIMLSLAFAALNHALHLPPFSLFRVALMLTDVMTLYFFFLVRDEGSWLEIGQTITFFCISSLLHVWSGGICTLGEYLMADVLVPVADQKQE